MGTAMVLFVFHKSVIHGPVKSDRGLKIAGREMSGNNGRRNRDDGFSENQPMVVMFPFEPAVPTSNRQSARDPTQIRWANHAGVCPRAKVILADFHWDMTFRGGM